MKNRNSDRLTRRKFLQGVGGTAATFAARSVGSARANTMAPVAGPPATVRRVRIGIVGGGFGSAFQWHMHPDCQVTAVCDVRQDRLQHLAQVYHCDNSYKDFREFLKHPELDAVAVFTPPHLHVAMATEAMQAGKHVISAVPAGLSVEELERLLESVKRTGLKYMMAETSRFRPEIQTCRGGELLKIRDYGTAPG
jgi:hypothetical protein